MKYDDGGVGSDGEGEGCVVKERDRGGVGRSGQRTRACVRACVLRLRAGENDSWRVQS